MKLIDLLSLINDCTNVAIFDANEDNQLGIYDGRDSVSEVYNNCNVVSIWKNEYEICIDIDA